MQLAGRVWVVPGAATGGFDEPRRIEVALESPGDLATADLDGDGLLDLAAGAGSPAVILLSGATIRRAGEVPVAARTLAVAGSPAALAAGDFDGDRFPDLAAACDSAGAVSYLRGAGIAGDQGAAAARKDIALAGSPTVLATGDLDGDGFLDLAAAGRGADHVTFIPGGPRGLEEASAVPAGRDPIALVAGELDGDGLLDLAAACAGSSFVSLLRGSDRGPSRGAPIPLAAPAFALIAGDFDRDGFTDVLASADRVNPQLFTLRQLYLRPHVSLIFDPERTEAFPAELTEPRSPPGYRLDELPRAPFESLTQVSLLPGPVPELPQAAWSAAGKKHLVNVTRPASLYLARVPLRDGDPGEAREGGAPEISGGARLTLRLRDLEGAVRDAVLGERPAPLQVFRASAGGGAWEPDHGLDGPPEVVDLARGKGIAFLVRRGGSYTVVVELER